MQITGGLIGSVTFHAVILLLFGLGLPHVRPPPLTVNTPMNVEIVTVDELDQSDRPPAITKPPPEKLEKLPEPAPPVAKKPPPMTAEAPPDLSAPQAPDTSEALSEVPPPPPPEPLERKEIEKPEPKKKPPAPPAKPVTKKPEAVKPVNDFQTLLKNLAPDVEKGTAAQDTPDLDNQAQPSPLERLAQRVTVSEEEALRAQLAKCWNVLSGAKYAEDLVVEVQVVVNPDRTVQTARVLNELSNIGNPHFRAAADAALRALRNPRCSPLALPPEKYETWKTTVIRFDPREML